MSDSIENHPDRAPPGSEPPSLEAPRTFGVPALGDSLRRGDIASSAVQYKALLRFVAHTFCRMGEACPLLWEDLDLHRAIGRLEQKDRAFPLVPLSTQVVALLHGFQRQGPYVFPALRDASRPIVPEHACRSWRKALGWRDRDPLPRWRLEYRTWRNAEFSDATEIGWNLGRSAAA